MKPYFASCLPFGSYGFTVDVGGGPVAFTVTSSVAAPLFFARSATSTVSAFRALGLALASATSGAWGGTFETSAAYGVIVEISRQGGLAFTLTADANAQAWFGLPASVSSISGTGPTRQLIKTVRQPAGTWFPNAYLANLDDFRPIDRQVFTSPLTGTASSVGIDQSDGVVRYWRCIEVTAVAGGRITSAKIGDTGLLAVTPGNATAWANAAGSALLVNQGALASLDGRNGWWANTVSGELEWAFSEDAEADSTYVSRHRFAYDSSAPTDMSGWRNLRGPNVEKRSFGNMLTDVRCCGVFIGNT
jgi:hypothetical protein